MSSELKSQKDGEVTSEGDDLTRLLYQAGLVALVPAMLAFFWLGLIREPLIQSGTAANLAQATVESRADMVGLYIKDLELRIDDLTTQLRGQTDAPDLSYARLSFPDADAISFIPLDDLGTVSISPGDFGLRSHIDIDIVRRAFGGEDPAPEFIFADDGSYTLFARGLGKPVRGVFVVEVSQRRLAELITPGNEGRYRIVQEISGTMSDTFIGTLKDEPLVSADVMGTLWKVEFSPNPEWLAAARPSWWGLLLSVVVTLAGIVASLYLLIQRSGQLLRSEVKRILEAAELRTPLRVSVPAITPLAKMLRQLSLLSRRQLVLQARREATRGDLGDVTVKDSDVSMPEPTEAAPTPRELLVDHDSASIIDEIPTHIFKPGSIRGDVQTELTEALIESIGQALAVMSGDRDIQTLIVAHDSRPSSKQIRTVLVKALLASGRDVIDVGEIPTPAFYFATHEAETDSGIMITGGHGDEHINGFKIVFHKKLLSGVGIEEILATIRSKKTVQGSGRTIRSRIEADYIDRIAMDVSLALPLKVVIDNDFGTSARITEPLLSALDCDLVSLNSPEEGPRPQGRCLAEALEALGERVIAEGADLGVLFDSDGDRLHTVTETGIAVGNDSLLMLFARDMLERNPGADVVYDIQCTRLFAPFVTRTGGRAQMSRSGQAFIAEKMQQARALLAGDFSGHIFFAERWYGFDDAPYAMARLLEILATASSGFGDIIAALPQSSSTPEILLQLESRSRKKIMRALVSNADFPGARITTLDGLRVDYADGWGLVHNSITESALSLRFEGNDDASLERVKGVLRKAITEAEPSINLPF
ncbi:phosphomannomutase/phosphoglucomutase [Luminiphilus sp. nBUS_16]|uniref:phosphomannomutase/phosphoglucomutase n=1 Tax=Luminiphilus sp. nBUS_16 TaxID=3395315 RepID=UPI003EB73F49